MTFSQQTTRARRLARVSANAVTVTDTDDVIKDYLPQTKKEPSGPLSHKRRDLIIDGGRLLKPGEYNATFKYLDNETPSIAFEVYQRR